MRDPQVVSLRYDLRPHTTVTFDNPPPIERETDAFRMRLADGIATFDMKEHFASGHDAKRCVEEWLRAWEIHERLRFGQSVISFAFKDAEVIDRDPPLLGTPQVVKISGSVNLTMSAVPPTLHVTRRYYPEPPARFMVSPHVETMWSRWQGYVDGKEPLAGMAYFCLTVFELGTVRRRAAARQYNVANQVLGKLGELTSNVGDAQTARKFSGTATARSHTETEIQWLRAAVKLLIRRKGEYDADPFATLSQLTMSDLPTI